MGHSEPIWKKHPKAGVHLFTTFFDTGQVNTPLSTYHPMDFDVGLMSFPMLAKVLMTAIILIPLLLIWVV